ncbi:hypothetical protein ACO2Q3_12600 [Caulobacter sp. KR2-114]|uniref:hypothetical protein n=1 Tax=Caulobacter sp. KR2-114 TaxID=3400912 RepID=UPI003C10D9F3
MSKYLVLCNLGIGDDERDNANLIESRKVEIIKYLFTLGPAWMASGDSIFVDTEESQTSIIEGAKIILKDYDAFFILELVDVGRATYSGALMDAEGAILLFPNVDLRPT